MNLRLAGMLELGYRDREIVGPIAQAVVQVPTHSINDKRSYFRVYIYDGGVLVFEHYVMVD